MDPGSALNVGNHMCRILMRYKAAGARDFASAKHLSVAGDGSRFSGRDLVSLLLVAHCEDLDRWKAMWLAPEVIIKRMLR